MNNILLKAFFIGVFGDLTLQLIVKQQGDFAGLRDYFSQHGIMESAMVGGGIMFLATWIYLKLNLPLKIAPLFIYGGILDIIWRHLNLMPSLENTYYKKLTPFWSFIWGGIPMIMILAGEKNVKFL